MVFEFSYLILGSGCLIICANVNTHLESKQHEETLHKNLLNKLKLQIPEKLQSYFSKVSTEFGFIRTVESRKDYPLVTSTVFHPLSDDEVEELLNDAGFRKGVPV